MKTYTLQGHPYSHDEPIPGDETPIPGAAKIIALVVLVALVVGFVFSKRRER